MLVNGSTVTSSDEASIHGADIDKNAKLQKTYENLGWRFGNDDGIKREAVPKWAAFLNLIHVKTVGIVYQNGKHRLDKRYIHFV